MQNTLPCATSTTGGFLQIVQHDDGTFDVESHPRGKDAFRFGEHYGSLEQAKIIMWRAVRISEEEAVADQLFTAMLADWQNASEFPSIARPADLIGTPKQIAYAERLRTRLLREARDYYLPHFFNPENDPDAKRDAARLFSKAYAKLAAHASASWWIDREYRTGDMLMRDEAQKLVESK